MTTTIIVYTVLVYAIAAIDIVRTLRTDYRITL